MSESAAATGRRELTLRRRRELGLTLSNISSVVKDLKSEGEIDKDTSRAVIAAMVLSRMQDSNQNFAGLDGFDIQSILDLIEALLPMILKLMELFS